MLHVRSLLALLALHNALGADWGLWIESPATIDDGKAAQPTLNVTVLGCWEGFVNASVADEGIAEVDASAAWQCTNSSALDERNSSVRLRLFGRFLGRTTVRLSIDSPNGSLERSLPLAVVRAPFIMNTLFNIVLPFFVVMNNIAFGCTLDLRVVRSILRRPVAAVLAILCQFVLMPLMSFSVIKILRIDSQLALGLFASGCAPGGGSSNVWTILLDGDINLSLTLTFLSNIICIGTLPLWLYTLGSTVWDSNVKIPYANVLITLATLIGGVSIGLLIRYCKEPVAKFIAERVLKKLSAVFVCFLLVFGIIGNFYIFRLFGDPVVLPAGLMLPWSGLLISGFFAWMLRFSWPLVRTIAIETSIQNTGLPILLLRYSVGQPEADLATVMPIAIAIFTPLPLLATLIARCVWKRKRAKKTVDDIAEHEKTPPDEPPPFVVSTEAALKPVTSFEESRATGSDAHMLADD